jgi:hypothetical protein
MAADCGPLRFATRSLEVPGGDYAGFSYRVEAQVALWTRSGPFPLTSGARASQ